MFRKGIKVFYLFSLISAYILLVSCSDSVDPNANDNFPLGGSWDVKVTFYDTTGVNEPYESLVSRQIFVINGSKVKWTTLAGTEDELTIDWELKTSGNDFEIYNQYVARNRYSGKMRNNDEFEMLWGEGPASLIELSLPGYNKAISIGQRVEEE